MSEGSKGLVGLSLKQEKSIKEGFIYAIGMVLSLRHI